MGQSENIDENIPSTDLISESGGLQDDLPKVCTCPKPSVEDLEKMKRSYEKRRKKVIAILSIVTFIANSAYSSIAPFYPQEAVNKGIPKSFLGLIFSGFSIAMILFAPLFGTMLTKCGRKNVLMLGTLCVSIPIILFGVIIDVEDTATFGILGFVCRVFEGFGNGCLNSATSSIISFNYNEDMSNIIGII